MSTLVNIIQHSFINTIHTSVLQQGVSVVFVEYLLHSLAHLLAILPDCVLKVREMFVTLTPQNLVINCLTDLDLENDLGYLMWNKRS